MKFIKTLPCLLIFFLPCCTTEISMAYSDDGGDAKVMDSATNTPDVKADVTFPFKPL